jgi:hypothetical protein
MNILEEVTLTPSMFAAGTNIPVVDAGSGEVLWVSGGTYTVGNERVHDGAIYECVADVTGSVVLPPNDGTHWLFKSPTNRMAPFDDYLYTKARRAGSIVYQFDPGFITGLDLHGVEGDRVQVSVTAGPAGPNLILPVDVELWEQAYGEYDYLFGELQRATKFTLKNIPIHPAARVTVTVSRNDPLEIAAIGFLRVGKWQRLLAPKQQIGAALYGMEASTKDYSYEKDYPDGTYETIPGRKATNIALTCVIEAADAPRTKNLLDRILGKAVAIEVSDLPRYGHLSTVGKVTGIVKSPNWPTAEVSLQIKGNV